MATPHDRLRDDPELGPLVERHGELAPERAEHLFERLVVSVLRQQVSTASAAATRERLFDAVGDPDGPGPAVTPADLLAADPETLSAAGLSEQKRRYVRAAAEAFEERGYDRAVFASMDDDAVRAELTSITGVGAWTANMQLLFGLGREDVFPVGDLGVRKAMRSLFGDIDRAEMVEVAERWAPYRSYATLYLWTVSD